MEQMISQNDNEIKFRKLRRFNFIMAVLHFGQGLAMLLVSSNFSLPVTSSYVQFSPTAGKLVPVLTNVLDLRIAPIIAAFLFLSALAHFCVSAVPGVNRWYNNHLAKGINPARWIEYAFSSSLMMVVICMLVGMYDGVSLLLVFFLNMMMILFGWVMEIVNMNRPRVNWISYIFGSIAGAIPWVAVALYLFNSGGETGHAPTFVYWIFFSIFLFFNCFAINMVLQYKKIGKWRDYLYGERAYIILSLVAKSLLAWQVFAGTLRPV